MSFYNRLEKQNEHLSLYSKKINSLFGQLLLFSKGWSNDRFLPYDPLDHRPLFVLVSTAKGLCGGLNTNLFKYFEQAVYLDPHQQPSFIVIGTKGITYLKNRAQTPIVAAYPEVNSSNLFALTQELIVRILFSDKDYTSVSFFSNHTRSFFSQKPRKTTILPLPVSEIKNNYNDKFDIDAEADLIWEQTSDDLIDQLAMRYLHDSILQLLFGAMRAEQAARFMAMDSSTNNAEKYLEPLIMQFNKLRQSLITKEIFEFVAGRPQQ